MKFLFMAGVSSHPYAVHVLRAVAEYNAHRELIDQLSNMDSRRSFIQKEEVARSLLNNELQNHTPQFPMLVILSPIPTPATTIWKLPIPRFLRRRPKFEVVGLLPFHAVDVNAGEVVAYLRNIVYEPVRTRTLGGLHHIDPDTSLYSDNSNMSGMVDDPGV